MTPSVDPILTRQVKRDEGGPFLTAYPDPLSPLATWALRNGRHWAEAPAGLSGAPWTWGWGHTGPEVHQGYGGTIELAEAVLQSDLTLHNALLARVLPWSSTLEPPRLRVLQNMVFNLGWDNPKTPAHEGLSGFVNTLASVQTGHFGAAADGMLASAWARQVKSRATRLAQQMRTGADVL